MVREILLLVGILLLSRAADQKAFASSAKDTTTPGPAARGVTTTDSAVNPEMFLAMGDCGTTLSSKDGITWLSRISAGVTNETNDRSVAFGNNMMVRVDPKFGIEISTNDLWWTSQRSVFPNRLYAVAFGNGLFVAVGNEGALASSAD